MVQPGDPYQNQGYGGQQPWGQQPPAPVPDPWGQQPPPPAPDPWGQSAPPPQPGWSPPAAPGWGQPPQQPGAWGPAPEPWGNTPVSAAPTTGWPGQPPPPPKSNTGLIVGLISGIVVLLLVAGVVGLFLFGGQDKENPVANPSGAASASPSEESVTASPTPEGTDPESLDSEDTDETSLTTRAIFPDRSFTGDDDETYTLSGTLETDACTGVGSGKVKSLMKEYDCDRMVVGVWLNEDEKLFSALLVIPFASDDTADDVHSDLTADKQEMINALTYYCPSDGKPGAKLCSRGSDNLPTWYASFTTFHRYLFVAISLYTDGHRTKDMSDVDAFTTETTGYVQRVLLGEE